MTFQDAPAAQIALAEAAAKAAVAPPPTRRAARFVGDAKAFWRLQLRGAMLLAVTLGIYRFWLATDVRRFLWSNTEIAGESLEYNGTPTELLVGFLIAIALLVPLNLGLFVVALSLGPAGEFVSMLGFPLLFVLGQFAIYRARRYRLTRTVLRGVRCHQTGSGVRYAFCCDVLVEPGRAHAGARLSVHAGEPRALQDAQHLVRRPCRPLRGLGLACCSRAAC